jgi:hypothetical protein
MGGKKSGSDNPWAEMSRLKLQDKESKSPAPDSPRSATIKSEAASKEVNQGALKEEIIEKSPATTGAVATTREKAILENEKKGEQVVKNEEVIAYSADELGEMSLEDLQSLAEENGIASKGLSKEELVEALFEKLGISEEMEEEILLEDEEEIEEEVIGGEMSLEEAFALLGEDGETEEDLEEIEFEEVEEEVLEGEVEESGTNN